MIKQNPIKSILRFVCLASVIPVFSVYSQNIKSEVIEENNTEFELKRGDLLVRANHNTLIGTSFVQGGSNFGHAAIVLKGGKDTDAITLLKKTIIFESHAQDVPSSLQIRETIAYYESSSKDSISLSFSDNYKGSRYVLRANLSEDQIENIIAFIAEQDDGTSSWRATKDYDSTSTNYPRNWYCSLLIWQAFYTVLGEDIDVNKGLIVYPNDIINSPFFTEHGYVLRF